MKISRCSIMQSIQKERFIHLDNMLWNREAEKEYIQNALQSPFEMYGSINFFYGVSGVGKSRLCEYTRLYIKTHIEMSYALVSIDMSPSLTEEQIVRKLYQDLSVKEELSFPRYEVASDYLFRISEDPSYKIEAPKTVNRVIDNMVDGVAAFGNSALELLNPVESSLISTFAFNLAQCVVERASNWAKSSLKKALHEHEINKQQRKLEIFFNELNSCSKEEIQRNLSQYFTEDLNQSLEFIHSISGDQTYRTIITIDAFEKRSHNKSFDSFFSQLFRNFKGTIWFIFSTEKSILTNGDDNLSTKHSYPVKCFKPEKVREYLKKQGIVDDKELDIFVNASDGLPAAVRIMLELYRKNDNHFAETTKLKGYEALFNQYFIHHLTVEEQVIFTRLALFDSWNKEVFSYIGPSENHQEIFEKVSNNTALVVKASEFEHGEERYCLVDIVRKTLIARFECSSQGIRMDSYRCKFNYERKISDDLLWQLKKDVFVDQEFNDQLRYHCEQAFRAAILSYSCKSEFEEISTWCTQVQQALPRGLFSLKADLTKLYLEMVNQRDNFRYDTEDDPQKRFRFQNTRDRVWALRFSSNGKKAVALAGKYCNDLLVKFGINSPHISFSLYLWGLTFQDVGDYSTAQWLFRQSISVDTFGTLDPMELRSPIFAVAHNVLGCLNMDLNHFSEAEKDLLESQKTCSVKDINGQRIGYHNLSKLYFRWAQELARSDPRCKQASDYLALAEKNLQKEEQLTQKIEIKCVADQYSVHTRKIMLSIAWDRLSEKVGKDAPIWREYFDFLSNAAYKIQADGISSAKVVLAIKQNIAVMYALQMDFFEAKRLLLKCEEASKKLYYDLDGKNAQNKPCIRELRENITAVNRYIENPKCHFDPYDFRIQF